MSAPLIGIQTTLYLWLISAFGYDQGADVQSESAQLGIRIGTAAVPVIFALAGAVALLFLPYTRHVEAELSAFSHDRRGAQTAFTEAERPALAPRE